MDSEPPKMLRMRAKSQRNLQTEAALRASIRHQLGGHGFRSSTMYPAHPSEGRPGGRRKLWRLITAAPCQPSTSNTQRVDCLPKCPGSHSSSPHARPHHFFHFRACNAQNSQGKDNREPWRDHNSLRMGCLRFSGDIQNQPSLRIETAADSLIRETQASLQPLFAWGAYRQISRCVVFLIIFVSTMTCLPLELSLDTDGAIYLILVPSHVTFPNDGIRLQESKQQYTIPRETVKCVIFVEISISVIDP